MNFHSKCFLGAKSNYISFISALMLKGFLFLCGCIGGDSIKLLFKALKLLMLESRNT